MRTPSGALGAYVVDRLARGAALPTLTETFSTGAVALPSPERLAAALVVPVTPAPPDGLPEPYRTASLTLSPALLPALDAAWAADPSAESALEVVAVGADLRARAIARARWVGDADSTAYAVHRRWLPLAAQRAADQLVGGTLALATVLDLAWPIADSPRITSPFGDRLHPVLHIQKLHNGVDFGVPVGTPVRAAQAGMVAVAGQDPWNGRYVVLDHGFGVRTSYCHLSEVRAVQGASIGRAEALGASGNTGRSTGPHLHFTLKIGGRPVDPAWYLGRSVRP